MNAASTPPVHDALVARLKADLVPVRPLWSPAVRLLCWLLLSGSVIAVATGLSLRHDLRAAVRGPVRLAELGMLLATATIAASAAFHGAVPGRGGRRLGWLATACAVGSAALLLAEPALPSAPAASFVASGVQCAACVTLFGLLPWIAILVAIRRAAPLAAGATGAVAGAAAFVVGAVAVRVACPIDDPVHVVAWHLGPVVSWTVISAVLGASWPARWRAGTASDR